MAQRVLVVDDSFYMRTMLKNMLSDAGYNIVGEAADVGDDAECCRDVPIEDRRVEVYVNQATIGPDGRGRTDSAIVEIRPERDGAIHAESRVLACPDRGCQTAAPE